MLSIPRDTRTEIVGHGTTDKLTTLMPLARKKWRSKYRRAFDGHSD